MKDHLGQLIEKKAAGKEGISGVVYGPGKKGV